MKILYVTGHSPFFGNKVGGSEISSRLLAEKMASRGHEVHFLSSGGISAIIPINRKRYYEKIRLYRYGKVAGATKLKRILFFNKKQILALLKRIIFNNQIDIVYTHYDLRLLRPIIDLKSENLDFKIMMRMAGMYWYEECLKSPHLIPEYESAFNTIDAVHFLNYDQIETVSSKMSSISMNVKFKKIFVGDVRCETEFNKQSPIRKNDGVFKILMVARFSEYQKRQDLLVEAFKMVDESLPLELLFIGDGPNKQRIIENVKNGGLEDRIKFLSQMSQTDLWNIMCDSDMLCLATEYEGISKVVVEAMAMGLPVLVSKVTPFDELISDGENGYLVENRVSDWSSKLEHIFKSRKDLPILAQRAKTSILKNIDNESEIIAFESFLRSMTE